MYAITDDGQPIPRTYLGSGTFNTVEEVCEVKRELERRFRFRSGWTQAQIAWNTPYSIILAEDGRSLNVAHRVWERESHESV